jgi:acyl carrier protein
VWITSSGNQETFQLAGASGANILTHLLGQDLNELRQKIAAYREAWHQHGHDAQGQQGQVTLMVHTFIGTNLQTVRNTVRKPFSDYLRSSAELMKSLAQSLGQDITQVTDDDMDALVAHAFERYVDSSGLMGTVESCLPIVEQIKTLGVDEIACLIDFGVAAEDVLASLQHLATLKEQSNQQQQQTQHEELSVAQQLIKSGASYLQCTPSMMNMLLLLPETADALRNVRHLLLGGEALPLALIKKLQKLTPATLHNMYGPTETTIWSSTAMLPPDCSRIDLGQPIANTQIYILDHELQPVPRGVAGELYIGGQGVARGYLQRSDLTAERFLPDPWSGGSGARMYRSGDLARYHADGQIEYLGRVDQQIKLRGFRIELGEIEAVLQAHPMIQEAAVIVSTPDTPYLVAYVVIREGAEVETTTLQTYLRTQVPDYMVPALFIALSALPKTPNGKFDRHALPALEHAQTLSSTTFVAPTTPLQVELAELWAQKLHLTEVGITDNFFKLGGHSLAAVEIITHLRENFQVSISLRNLFETPTITALAHLIEQELALKQEEDLAEDTEFAQILQDLEAFSNDEVEHIFSSSEGK